MPCRYFNLSKMMFKKIHYFLCAMGLAGGSIPADAQHSYLAADGVAVFYPSGYNSADHSPSPIFLRDLSPAGSIPEDWKIRPVFSAADGKTSVTLVPDCEVDFYGTGEVTGNLRRNGKKIDLWNFDNLEYQRDNGSHLYQSHPWVMGLRPDGSAFGIIADNAWKSSLDLADNKVRFDSEGPAFRVIVIEKDSPETLMAALAELTGHIEMPPLWALGYQQSRWSYSPAARVKEIADTLRYHRIPSDVIWMDIDYMDNFKIFTFDPEGFPDPKSLNDYLHDRGFKTVYMIDPGVKAEKGYFVDDLGSAADYWVKDENGDVYEGNVWPGICHFPDFTRPEVRNWWSSLYPDFMAHGIDGVWNDMNEPAIFDVPSATMPETNLHAGGDGYTPGSHLRYHNIYGYNMVKASRDGLLRANPDKRPFILTRSNFLGGHRYAATWTGDNGSTSELMKMSIPMTLNLGLSGQPFNGPDIGGFNRDVTPELLAAWTAIGVYFPFVRNHAIKQCINQEPWALGEETLNVCRTAINRRYRLLPYIYTLFREASQNGMPVMRPLFFADVKDTTLRREQQAFLLGSDLMIVPRYAKHHARPKGDWRLLALEQEDDGHQALLYQRPGSIIPLADLFQNTEEYNTDTLTLLINPDETGRATGTMYEDTGEGFGYKKGEYAEFKAIANIEDNYLCVSLQRIGGSLKTCPKQVQVCLVENGNIICYGNISDNEIMKCPIQ